ncbi:MAG: radical SAM protein, partial [Candidatus Limivicinus sp.]
MSDMIRETRSVCPVCLKNIPARLSRGDGGEIVLEKTCPNHGFFQVPVWQGKLDFDRWLLRAEPLAGEAGLHCPANCGICAE